MQTRAPSDGPLTTPREKQHCSCYYCQLKKTNRRLRAKGRCRKEQVLGKNKSIKADPVKRGVSEYACNQDMRRHLPMKQTPVDWLSTICTYYIHNKDRWPFLPTSTCKTDRFLFLFYGISIKFDSSDRDRTRTCNPQIRNMMPSPLGHVAALADQHLLDGLICIFVLCYGITEVFYSTTLAETIGAHLYHHKLFAGPSDCATTMTTSAMHCC
jgi:hypothetical protein